MNRASICLYQRDEANPPRRGSKEPKQKPGNTPACWRHTPSEHVRRDQKAPEGQVPERGVALEAANDDGRSQTSSLAATAHLLH